MAILWPDTVCWYRGDLIRAGNPLLPDILEDADIKIVAPWNVWECAYCGRKNDRGPHRCECHYCGAPAYEGFIRSKEE